MKKRTVLCVVLAVFMWVAGGVHAQQADLIVLMDASGTILPWFDQINSRVLPDITRKFVREGDTFHLISFNSRSNLEIVQPIHSESDVSRVVSRFMLLYPIGQHSDFLTGIQYTWQYINTLEQARKKIVIIVSDGIFNPHSSSNYASLTPEQVKTELTSYANKIRGAGWEVYYIKLPFPDNAKIVTLDGAALTTIQETASISDGAQPADSSTSTAESTTETDDSVKYTDISGDFTEAMEIDPTILPATGDAVEFAQSLPLLPQIEFPKSLGKRSRNFTLNLKVKNPSTKPLLLELSGVLSNGVDVLAKRAFKTIQPNGKGTLGAEIRLPDSIEDGPRSIDLELVFSDGRRVTPQSAYLDITIVPFSLSDFVRTSGSVFFTVIFVLIAIALVVVLFLFISHHTSKPAFKLVQNQNTKNAEVSPASLGSSASQGGQAQQGSHPQQQTGYSGSRAPLPAATSRGGALDSSAQFGSTTQLGGPASLGGDPRMANRADTLNQAGTVSRERTDLGSAISKRGNGLSQPDYASKRSDTQAFLDQYQNKTSTTNTLLMDELAGETARSRQQKMLTLAEQSAKSRGVSRAASFTAANPDERIAVKSHENVLFELFVRYQNPHIGKRNIHLMKPGTKLSIGGGNSAFLIFLVKFPTRIADIRFDGKQCSLAILKPSYFPYETQSVIEDCAGREFTVVSDKDYEVVFKIREYEDPVIKLNKLLNSIRI